MRDKEELTQAVRRVRTFVLENTDLIDTLCNILDEQKVPSEVGEQALIWIASMSMGRNKRNIDTNIAFQDTLAVGFCLGEEICASVSPTH